VPRARLLVEDPDLASRLEERTAQTLQDLLLVPIEDVPTGPWSPPERDGPVGGFIVLDGALAKNASIVDSTTTQLFGPGALVQPGADRDETLLPWRTAWYAVSPTRLAELDERVVAAAWHHPGLAAALLARAAETAADAGFILAASNLSRLDARLLALLWHLADRFGHVATDGMVLHLPLSHRLLAQMVGAQRPSVTTALRQLSERDALARRDDGAWLLLGDPVEALERTLSTSPLRQPVGARPVLPRVREPHHVSQAAFAASLHRPTAKIQFTALEARLNEQLRRLREDHLKSAQRMTETVEKSQEVRSATAELRGEIIRRRAEQSAA